MIYFYHNFTSFLFFVCVLTENGRKNTAAKQPVDRGRSLRLQYSKGYSKRHAKGRSLNSHLYRTHIQLADGDLVIHHCFKLLSDLLKQIFLSKI